LGVPCLDHHDELSLLPLAAKVNHLENELYVALQLMEDYLHSLNTVAKKLSVVIRNGDVGFPIDFVVVLFRRIAAFGGLLELKIRCFISLAVISMYPILSHKN
jgi:hypothetical protein